MTLNFVAESEKAISVSKVSSKKKVFRSEDFYKYDFRNYLSAIGTYFLNTSPL
jgi:hypothetical protein